MYEVTPSQNNKGRNNQHESAKENEEFILEVSERLSCVVGAK